VTHDSIVLLAPDSLAELGRSAPVGTGPTVGAVGDRQAVALATSRSLVPAISLVSW
jgi:hypothetical protein